MGLPIFEEILFDSSLKKRRTQWEPVRTCLVLTSIIGHLPSVDLSLSGSSLISGLKAQGASVKYLGTFRLTFLIALNLGIAADTVFMHFGEESSRPSHSDWEWEEC